MNDEERQKALECCLLGECMSCPIIRFQDCRRMLKDETISHLNRQQERIEELEIITGLANNRKYYRKFVDEIFCRQEGNELSEPDFDYIYQLYFEQQAEIDDLKRDTVPKLQDSLNRANKSGIKLERENARLKAEIERLQGAVQEWVDGKCLSQKHLLMIGNLQNEIEQAKSEAIKEFAERLKESIIQEKELHDLSVKCAKNLLSIDYQQGYEEKNNKIVMCIDNLLAEKAGEQNV